MRKPAARILRLLVPCILAVAMAAAAWGLWSWYQHRGKLPAKVMQQVAAARSWTVLSIDPKPRGASAGRFHGYDVLGSLPLSDPQPALTVIGELDHAVSKGGTEQLACEFAPRHGLEGRMPDGRTIEFLICYECGQFLIFGESAPKGFLYFSGAEPGPLNELLAINRIPLPNQPK
jgi:hypothetical protein